MQAYTLGNVLSSFVVLAIAGCASLKVRTDYDELASFAELRTYDWVDQGVHEPLVADNGDGYSTNGNGSGSAEPAIHSPILGRRIRGEIDSELARLGYRRDVSGAPDFRVAFKVLTEKETDTYSGGYGGSYSPYSFGHGGFGHGGFGHGGFGHGGFGHGGFGHGGFGHFGLSPYYGSSYYGPAIVRQYVQGTLVLDIVDGRTNELIWRGWATDRLDDDPKPKQVRHYVTAAVQKILEEFPPAG